MGFRAHLEKAKIGSGRLLAKSTMRAIMSTLRDFAIWLSHQDGFRRRIKLEHADYFRLSLRDEAEARAAPERAAPSIKQAKRVLALMHLQSARQSDLRASLSYGGARVPAVAALCASSRSSGVVRYRCRARRQGSRPHDPMLDHAFRYVPIVFG